MSKPTPSDIKYQYEQKNPQGTFFTYEVMRFAGDTMRNYGVRDAGEYWELYRKKPVKNGLASSHYFHKQTLKHISQMTYERLQVRTLKSLEDEHNRARKGVRLPKFTQFRIYWQPERPDYGIAFVLIGYCPDNLAYFRAMFRRARKDFPDLKEEDCTCGKVTRSSSVNGFTLLSFRVDGPKRDIPGWDPWETIDFSY